MGAGVVQPGAVLAALARYPPLERGAGRLAVVGGFVRDVALGRDPRELDLVVEGDAGELARSLGGEVVVHEPFGTASASGEGWRVDVAMARREHYSAPGVLPTVEPASIEQDLARRDFTVNTLAVTLDDGVLLCVDGAEQDLASGTLRVLHEHSFVDDPTRLVRLARYAERLGFVPDAQTVLLAREASFATLSGARLGAELRLALAEPDPVAVLARLAEQLPLTIDRPLAQAALDLSPPDGDRSMLLLGALAREEAWLHRLELTSRELAVALACHRASVPTDTTPSALWRAWHGVPIEAVAVAGARGGADAARRWIEELRLVALAIGGDDLIAAGVPEGPQIGRRLERTLAARLDGELAGGREVELAYALERGS